jgi:hypothetical protein
MSRVYPLAIGLRICMAPRYRRQLPVKSGVSLCQRVAGVEWLAALKDTVHQRPADDPSAPIALVGDRNIGVITVEPDMSPRVGYRAAIAEIDIMVVETASGADLNNHGVEIDARV